MSQRLCVGQRWLVRGGGVRRCREGFREPRTGPGDRVAHIIESHRLLRSIYKVKYAFIAKHRDLFGVRAMCWCVAVQPGGQYAYQKSPPCQRARKDDRQTGLILQAWNDSGKVYGYRKRYDALLDHGEICCPNRLARLSRLAGIRALMGYQRRPGSYVGKPSLAIDNTVDR